MVVMVVAVAIVAAAVEVIIRVIGAVRRVRRWYGCGVLVSLVAKVLVVGLASDFRARPLVAKSNQTSAVPRGPLHLSPGLFVTSIPPPQTNPHRSHIVNKHISITRIFLFFPLSHHINCYICLYRGCI